MVAEPNDDHRLVAAVRRGDDRAFEALYSRYHRRIHAYVMGMVKDHGRAEDVTQEVFVSALRRMRETERPIAFKPWIYEIAKNACIDQFRRSRRAEEVSLRGRRGPRARATTAGSSGPTRRPTPRSPPSRTSTTCAARSAACPTPTTRSSCMREFEGMSYREIGERLGMSRPAVESTLFRARRRLTEEYDDLVSGARCQRIQSLIAAAGETRLGTRESRRLSRHVAHCQPCRREAMAAGLDSAILTHVPLRKRAAEKIAALLPVRLVRARPRRRRRRDARAAGPRTSRCSPTSSQGGWGKLATAAAVLVAGVGAAGVGTKVVGSGDQPPARRPPGRDRAHRRPRAGPARAARPTRATLGTVGSQKAAKKSRKGDRAGRAQTRAARRGRRRRGDAAGRPRSAGDGGGAAAGGSVRPAAPQGPAEASSSRSAATIPIAPVQETVEDVVEAVPPVVEAVPPVVDGVTDTVEQTGGTLEDTVEDVGGAAGGATDGILP